MNEVQCSNNVKLLIDELWQCAIGDFSAASISLITKQSAREFYQSILPLPCLSFHLQSVQGPFTSWEHSDPRDSKEVLNCKVLTIPAANVFLVSPPKLERTKVNDS